MITGFRPTSFVVQEVFFLQDVEHLHVLDDCLTLTFFKAVPASLVTARPFADAPRSRS